MIDLGLPSGTLWADRNVDAASVSSFGNYFAFGETKTKATFMNDNYTVPDIDDIAGTQYDVATVKYGKGWQIPSKDDWQELFDNCKNDCIYQGNQLYFKFTGPNGAYILLPFPKENIYFIAKNAAFTKQQLSSNQTFQNLNLVKKAFAQKNIKFSYGMLAYNTSDKTTVLIVGKAFSNNVESVSRGNNEFQTNDHLLGDFLAQMQKSVAEHHEG